jgi:hypothetical protein
MQPSTPTSPWPKWILIAGIVLALCGSLSLALAGEHFTDFYDPRETSEHTAEFGEINTITLEPGCWVVNVEESDSDYDVSFNYVENGTAGKKVSDDCRTDFQEQTDVDFVTVTKLDIKETSEILVSISCEPDDGCENPLLFTNGDAVVMKMLTDPTVLVTGGLCCIGFMLVPLGWILISINRGRENRVHISQDQVVTAMTPMDDDLPPNNEIPTTDELYKLIRGEMPMPEDGDKPVPGPFADADTRIRTATAAKISGSINKASIHTPENPPKDDSWKNWDGA